VLPGSRIDLIDRKRKEGARTIKDVLVLAVDLIRGDPRDVPPEIPIRVTVAIRSDEVASLLEVASQGDLLLILGKTGENPGPSASVGATAGQVARSNHIQPHVLPRSMRACAIRVPADRYEPSSRVDVIFVPHNAPGRNNPRVILQDLLILAVDRHMPLPPTKFVVVTLAVSIDEAKELDAAQTQGTLLLVTRSVEEAEVIPPPRLQSPDLSRFP
jgi:Flp pilus assembly protein CpaB